MLKPAYFYKLPLQEEYQNIIFNEKYKYYFCSSYWKYEFELSHGDNDWNGFECVSIDKNNKIIGYLCADFYREEERVMSLKILNFKEKCNATFSRDLYEFISLIFNRYKMKKIEFSVVVGNPIEKMYDKYIKKYNGNIVGTFKDHVKLTTGEYCDYKMYEIFREDYLKVINS